MWTGVCVPDPNAAGSISYFYIIILTVQLQYKAQEIFEYPHIFPHSPRLNSKWDIFSRLVEPEFHEKSSLVWWGTSGPLKLNCNIKGGIELYILGWEEGWEKFLSFFFIKLISSNTFWSEKNTCQRRLIDLWPFT